jgi:predicted ATPase
VRTASAALEVYASARARLHDELGLEPGPELRRLQRRILQHDPALLPAPSSEMTAVLPTPPNRLLGRERELAELHELLLRDDVRLVVLAGAGGCGKTRLAVAAARLAAASFANGAVFAGLAPLRHPGQVIPAIWQALRLPEPTGGVDALAAALSSREQLLVLDSAEHVRAAGPALAGLLAQAPRLRLLVTSRVVLHLTGEHVYPVEPLRQEDAVLLFLERAREADPHLRLGPADEQAVREICRRLDGLPLAIELAAGRLRAISPPELLGRLDPRLPLLTGGPADLPARQLTMRATIEWSVGLLDAQQRRDLCRLSVFAGGATLAAAEAVCGVTLERLSVLVDHNLIHRSATTAGSRYLMLETIREYAAEQLRTRGEAEQIARRHLRFLVAQAEPANLSAEAEGPQDFGVIIPEHQNARAALEWAITAGEAELGLRLAIALENFWVTRNPFEGINLFTRLLAEADTALPAVLRGRALRACAGSAQLAGQPEQAQRLYEQSLTIFRALGDDQGIAILTYRLGLLALELGHPGRARPLLKQSRAAFEAIGSRRGQAQTIGAFGSLAHAEGNTALAATLYQHSATLAGQIGRTWWQARMLTKLADVALADEQYQDVTRWARQALLLARQIGNRQTIVYALAQLAAAAAAKNDRWRAGRLWGAIEADEARAPIGIWESAREPLASRVLGLATPELERGLQQGRCFSLDEAVADALEADPPEHTRP